MKNLKVLFTLFLLVTMIRTSYSQDWANLGKYMEDNLLIGTATSNRVVFLGDSVTEGWLTVNASFFIRKPYINRGISGQTSPQMLLRFRADVINLKPHVVVILAGTNDIAGNTGASTLQMVMDNIISMVELAKVNTIQVVLCSVLPANDYWWRKGIEPAEKIYSLNQMVKAYAEANKIAYVDYFTPMADGQKGLKKEYSNDGVHPNKEGYKVMEPIVEKAIMEFFHN